MSCVEPKTLKEIQEEVAVSIARNANVTASTGGYGTFTVQPRSAWGVRHVALAVAIGFAVVCLLMLLKW